MTGRFTEKDPQRCAHYARFMKHLTLPQANAVFWLLFISVLALMTISAIQHHKAVNIVDVEKGLSPTVKSTRRHRRHVRNKRKHYLGIAALCFIIAIICVVLEAFALFNIEYCDGEDLMQLYWGFWSILQVGSLIAIGGVMVQFWIVMGGVETPSWAVALGTPVLVFAALGWVFRFIGKQAWAKFTGKEVEETESEDDSGPEEEKNGSDHWTDTRSGTSTPKVILRRVEFASDIDVLKPISPMRFPSPLSMMHHRH